MSSNADNIILNLKMISKIPQHGRIYMRNNSFIIEEYSTLQGIKRFLSGHNRNQAVNEINVILEQAFEKNYSLLVSSRDLKNRETIKMILVELNNAMKGLKILSDTTYNNDYSVNSLIELYILKIETHLSEMNERISEVNKIQFNN